MAAADTLAGNPYADFGHTVAEAAPSARVDFVRKTYTHLAMAVSALVALEWAFFQTGIAESFAKFLIGMPYGLLINFGAFLAVSWMAERWASSEASVGKQYAGLMTYVVAESIFLMPLLWFAQEQTVSLAVNAGQPALEINVIGAAGVVTLIMFAGLSAIAWFSGKDFSFLGAALGVVGMAVFALIAASYFFGGLNLGVWFSVGMIVFASGYILYDTSNVMHHYRPGQHVAASLALFASVALLFFYLLRLFMALSSRD